MNLIRMRLFDTAYRFAFLFMIVLTLVSGRVFGQQDGSLDTTFEPKDGFAKWYPAGVNALALQSNGKILIGGHWSLLNGKNTSSGICRIHSDGSPDTSFHVSTKNLDYIKDIAIQTDGKILIGGRIRMNQNGSTDSTFRIDPHVYNLEDVKTVIQPDGKILIGGRNLIVDTRLYGVVRLNMDGSLDTSFRSTVTGLVDMALLPDGGVLINKRESLIKLKNNGCIDTTFYVEAGFANTIERMVALPDGRIIIGKHTHQQSGSPIVYITRLHADGSTDTSYRYTRNFSTSLSFLSLQTDGKLLMGINIDNSYTSFVTRLEADGTPDWFFGISLDRSFLGPGAAVQADGKVLVIKNYSNNTYHNDDEHSIIRISTNSTLDRSFQPVNLVTRQMGWVYCSAIQPDGKVVVGGRFSHYRGVPSKHLVRIDIDGSPDTTYKPRIDLDAVSTLLLQPDGKVIICGTSETRTDPGIIRLNGDGSKDLSFNPGRGLEGGYVSNIVLQPDGKAVLCGNLRFFDGVPVNHVVRINADGSWDPSFTADEGIRYTYGHFRYGMALQTDGKLVIGYDMVGDGSSDTSRCIARLNIDGSRDTSFHSGRGFETVAPSTYLMVCSISILPEGRILVGGNFLWYNQRPTGGSVTRLLPDGSLDTSFHAAPTPGFGLGNTVFCAIPQPDGRVLVGGDFLGGYRTHCGGVGRLMPNGYIDTSFHSSPGFFGSDAPVYYPNGQDSLAIIYSMVQEPGGKVVATGLYSSYDRITRNGIARLNNHMPAVPGPKPHIVIPHDSLDLGTVVIGRDSSVSFVVRNTGDTTLRITGISMPNISYSSSQSMGTLFPGDSLTMTITFTPRDTGLQIGILTLATNDYDHPACRITLIGTGIAAPFGKLSASVDSLWIPAVGLGGTSTASFQVRNKGTAPFAGLTLTSSNQYFSVTPTSFGSLAVGDSVPVSVTFQPTTLDPQSSTVTVRADGVDSVKVVFLSTQITGLNEVRSRSFSPNPAHPGQTLHIPDAGNSLHLTNMQGRLITHLHEEEEGQYALPTELAPGYYLLTSERGQRYRLCIAPR